MSSAPPEVGGQQTPVDRSTPYNALAFVIQQLINRVATVTLVEVLAVTNAGGVEAAGTVVIQILSDIVAGNGTTQEHGSIYNVPYFRLQGGAGAVILDPVVGDIGIALFCMNDVSAIKATKAHAPPASRRRYSYSDALYVGGILNGVPSQYVQFVAGLVLGAGVVSTTGNLVAGTGASGTFTTPTGQTVTVSDGIITNIY